MDFFDFEQAERLQKREEIRPSDCLLGNFVWTIISNERIGTFFIVLLSSIEIEGLFYLHSRGIWTSKAKTALLVLIGCGLLG